MEFVESNMQFSFPDEDSYMIEKSEVVSDYNSLKTCEVFAMINGKLTMIEAKSSSPRPMNKGKFDEYIADISRKFVDTILLFNAIMLNRHGRNYGEKLPANILSQDIKKLSFALYLIIHGNETEWMIPIQEALKKSLRHVLNAWNIPDVNVYALNHEDARRKGLIRQYMPLEILEQLKADGLKDNALAARVEQWLAENK